MGLVSVHRYSSEEQAAQALQLLNDALGYPVSNNAVTTTYTTVMHDANAGWYIPADETTIIHLGAPEDIEIN